MRWLRRARRPRPAKAAADGVLAPGADGPGGDLALDADALADLGLDAGAAGDDRFTCSTCGRTDLPPAGDWDPPICSECDAAINFDALVEADSFDER